MTHRGASRLSAAGAALSLFLSAGLAVTLAPSVAHAQNAIAVGVVDEDKLADGYKKYKDAMAAIDQRAQSLDGQIPAREFMSDDEGKQFDALIVNAAPTAPQNAQLKTLFDSGMSKRATYMSLSGKATKTPKDITDLRTLQDQMTKNGPALRAVSENLLGSIRQQQDDTDKQYTDQANSVVKQVAADRKLALIVRKKALVWSADSMDITDEVLSRLNK